MHPIIPHTAALMRFESFPGIPAQRHRNPGTFRIKGGTSATNPDPQPGTRAAGWFNDCHHYGQMVYPPISSIITVATLYVFLLIAQVF